MPGYCKLVDEITTSSIWMESDQTLRVWIAMLAKKDANGIVRASIPGFAHLCRMTVEQFEEVLQILMSPDKYSRTQDKEGRRVEPVEGGWKVINHTKYRDILQTDFSGDRVRALRKRKKEAKKENGTGTNTDTYTDTEETDCNDLKRNVTETALHKSKAKAQSIEEVISYCSTVGISEKDARYLWDNWEENGWMRGKHKIRDWRRAALVWKNNGFLPSQKNLQTKQNQPLNYQP
jgi:hypothetical protein